MSQMNRRRLPREQPRPDKAGPVEMFLFWTLALLLLAGGYVVAGLLLWRAFA